MSDGTSNQGPVKCQSCGWPVVRHLTPCPPVLALYDATDADVPLMQPEKPKPDVHYPTCDPR